MKMESPHASKPKIPGEGDTPTTKINKTPQNQKFKMTFGEEFSVYYLHSDSCPNIRIGQDVLEVGWGDSPEPLNLEPKIDPNKTPVTYKSKVEIKESPKSSIQCKRRNLRSTFSMPSKTIIDVAKYVAEVQELSEKIMKEFNSSGESDKPMKNDDYVPDTQIVKTSTRLLPEDNIFSNCKTSDCGNSTNSDNINFKEANFDNVLDSFINEEDDWLLQALSSQEVTKSSHKSCFVKSKSENELSLTQPVNFNSKLTENYRNINNNFKRTSSFDMTKTSNNSMCSDNSSNRNLSSSTQYSLQEIERKRLEAKFRRERREIERRKSEALKKLEMKKLRAIKK